MILLKLREVSKRTFIAIKITPNQNLSNSISEIKTFFSEDVVKWTSEDNLHLTLRFIGNTSETDIDMITEKLEQISKNFKSFEISIADFGVFGNRKRPRVLWLGLKEIENLQLLHFAITQKIRQIVNLKNETEFNPHLTIGRVKKINSNLKISVLENKFSHTTLQTVLVKEIIFYESILSPKGSVYKPLKIFRFKNEE